MTLVKKQEFDAQLLACIRVGLRKARELGYEVERMDVTASVSKGVCSVYFTPVPVSGTIVTGGDLSVTVDPDTEEVVEIKRGQ